MKQLGELCDVLDHMRKPVTKSDRTAGPYPYYGATGILDYVSEYIFDELLVLVGEDGAKWGSGENTAYAVKGKCWVNNHAHVLRPFREILIDKWLIYYLNHSDLKLFVSGLTVPKLNQGNLKKIPIPVPPLPEQQRFVDILDEAFEGIVRAKANAEKNIQNARELFEGYLQSVFTQRGEGWVERRLGEEDIMKIIDGDRGVNYPKSSEFTSDGFCLFLNTKNVRSDGFNFDTTMFITEEKDRQLRKGKLKRDDVVLTTRGTIGNVGHYSEDVPYDNIRINSGMLIFRPKKNKLLPTYLFQLFRSAIMKEQIKKYSTGAAQPQLPIKTLVNFNIPVPEIETQNVIIKKLHSFEPVTKKLEFIYQQKLTALDELKKSLLDQAFSGQL
ncbi:MAG: restriction endonuclease subunit S [Bacillota bacterium]